MNAITCGVKVCATYSGPQSAEKGMKRTAAYRRVKISPGNKPLSFAMSFIFEVVRTVKTSVTIIRIFRDTLRILSRRYALNRPISERVGKMMMYLFCDQTIHRRYIFAIR